MEKRYQVFVSSTYEDLQEERKEIMQALLELDCIPAGMELFPAANDDQWTLIKNVIDYSDYYIVVIGGRYGSIGPQGISYTEMEYRYALETGKPIIAFIHKNPLELPANKTESEKEGREKLDAFKSLAQQKMVRYWTTAADLGSVVSRSLISLIKTNSAIGWVRSDTVSDGGASKEILRLKNIIELLQIELKEVKSSAPLGTEEFSQKNDNFVVEYTYSGRKSSGSQFRNYRSEFSTTWNEIFYHMGPALMNEVTEEEIKKALNDFVAKKERKEFSRMNFSQVVSLAIDTSTIQTILIQFRVLGLITKSNKQRSIKDKSAYWTLTAYGDEYLLTLRAIKKE
ncbi:DUF4062 domain-containing protein [Paenibacillus macerans]|uniref:DUF4062 domain-containing protein n=1 Tax=Paenibacillus macerans TaxID=44252 RepID=UPI003D3169D7